MNYLDDITPPAKAQIQDKRAFQTVEIALSYCTCSSVTKRQWNP